ncbi:molybdopterin molybdotransferase MoeA [Streptomyces somaliensis]|uniref:Molybdopterin molybdenumtransferase n=1 Tax=Streptomyces somaliensis (strain ATCC 33201 / DSM 40738 / JCM 12659 / KCTC 9044 / NCTC 11332 / NRRL B-12077 / IP 733) TaxID=1134445 RepID=A0AA44D9Z5_STRE0|nr:molybdopterin molybdotransferase MoeA [Streptomyces somaliensis]NKY12898.1 molybdopterin molybdotransferase MoeA [Streptomyces somaliensis DSM 40738]
MTEPDVDGVDEALALVGGAPTRSAGHPSGPGDTPWDQARAVAARAGRRTAPRARRVPLHEALGRVLAAPLTALTDLPPFDTSAMDGWAVAGPGPWEVHTGDSVLAGRRGIPVLPDGVAVRIATGARVPADTTAVVRSEHARAEAGRGDRSGPGPGGHLHARYEVVPGQDIRPRGQECRRGDELLPAATLVTPAALGLAAAAGYDELAIVEPPRAEVLVLGDELLTSGVPRDGLIRDALGPMIGPWLHSLGAEVTAVRRVGDDAEALYEAVTGTDADLVVTTGGTAAGPVDHVRPVLLKAGAEFLVDGVRVRPGHPMLLARLAASRYLVGLPGNPLAAVSALLTLAEPLLHGLSEHPALEPLRAPVRDEVHGHPRDTRLVPVAFRAGEAVPLRHTGPAMLRGLAAADGLAVVPPGGVRSGGVLEVLDLPWTASTPAPVRGGCFT